MLHHCRRGASLPQCDATLPDRTLMARDLQVFIEDCLSNFEAPVANYIRVVNAMNGGKGLGLNAGSSTPKCARTAKKSRSKLTEAQPP